MEESSVSSKVEQFFTQFQLHEYKKGELIIQPEENPPEAFYLKKGYVKEYGISVQGIEIALHIFSAHSFFPMMWIISDIKNRYYYEALTDVEMYCAPKKETFDFIQNNSDVLLSLTDRLLKGLDKLTMRIEGFATSNANLKVVSVLIFLARHFGVPKEGTIELSYKFTHRDIAAFAGISRETASRRWKKLEDAGLIRYNKEYIVINNINKLNEILLM